MNRVKWVISALFPMLIQPEEGKDLEDKARFAIGVLIFLLCLSVVVSFL